MSARDIPRDEWGQFCERFSRQHRGGRVTLESVAPFGDTRMLAHELPLQGITLDKAGSHQAEIVVTVGQDSGEQLTHAIAAPARLLFWETEAGAHEGLDIASADGQVTRIRFRVPILLEAMDGVIT
jgi:hypothetical protein